MSYQTNRRQRWIVFRLGNIRVLLPEDTVRWLRMASPEEQLDYLYFWLSCEASD